MKKEIPKYAGTLRSHCLSVPDSVYEASGILIFGRRIKSLVFSTDAAVIKNINTDAVLAVYPFTPQASISKALISVSDVPVFAGVGGGLTSGDRSVRMALEVEMQGGFGVVVNAPMAPEVIQKIKDRIELPVVVTVISKNQNYAEQIAAGADILNVAAAAQTPSLVRAIREQYPEIPIIATGGPTDETIRETIAAGANAITYTPPTNGELFSATMRQYRERLET
ncbi:MAG: hydrolase [Lachnospiraceae bacterium]|nr:hydrolase [Lachnospiraceae bacterium]